ncbi:MAG: hypothetical protein QOE90_1049, partial [Thermoplasmata archaeon]|nr:hypothetical protein [Thermoplasmata archaeon]
FALAGAALMAWFAWGALRTARRGMGRDEDDAPEPWLRSFGKSYAIVVTSPYNWGWWLTAGSSMLTLFGFVVGIGFFVGLVLWTMGWCGLSMAGAARLTRFTEIVAYGAALVLAVFAVVMLSYAATTAWSLTHP